MKFFNIFKKTDHAVDSLANNGFLGPTFLEGLTLPVSDKLHSNEWKKQLKALSGETKFNIRYYGQLHEGYKGLITKTDFAPILLVAISVSCGQEILLFDGCKHGYNALLCDTFTEDQINRKAAHGYKDKSGNETFEVVISIYNGFDYDTEYADVVDENGLIELVNGSKAEFEKVKRDGFDVIRIWLANESGKKTEIVSEELA
jgi:hypothetical protein